jgi:putative tricarboxylic transport membrane protein
MLETLQLLGNGFLVVFEPLNLALIIGGCALDLFIGAMPGLRSVNGVAILLPLTFLVPPAGAIMFLAAIYYGAMYGGAISSIMLGIPGASTAVATTFDGQPMANKVLPTKPLSVQQSHHLLAALFQSFFSLSSHHRLHTLHWYSVRRKRSL